jgi:UDP-glucose 4-epimerase|tara:strand:+ start:4974 stop:5885 length:912 start_codon:yes stop_codon:yes gene_type:complete
MKCLVTGGAGFIGSNLVNELLDGGHEVVVIDNETSTCHEQFYWNDSANNYRYDICDYENILPLFEGVDVVFHVAAQARIQICIGNPLNSAKTNVYGTACVLEAARHHGVKRFVYSSTSSSYGLINEPPLVETMTRDCLNPYSITKCCGEDLSKNYVDIHGMEVIILRYFSVYGKNQPTKGPYSLVLGIFQKQKEQGIPLTVVGDGMQTRDYTNVSDIVSANILAATTKNEDAFGETFNVGRGKSYTVMDLVGMISKHESPIEGKDFVFIEERYGESRHTLSDCSKIKKYMGWEPKIHLEEWLS